jgi:2-C-methyl-D-erythritol 4-phosphate cytidylyltransferase
VTDEAGAMERAGHTVRLIEGRSDNIKITYTDDLALAEAILSSQLMR